MKVLFACVLNSLLISIVVAPPKQPQKEAAENILQRNVPGDEQEYLTTTDVFHSSLGRVSVPGGMVRIFNCREDTIKHSWKAQGSTLRQVLDAIVAADSRYHWEVSDGVVNLLPVSGEPALLRARINEFHIENTASSLDALLRLLKLPEVVEAMSKLHLKPGLMLVDYWSAPRQFSVRSNGVTLRQALNAIARANGRDIWEYVEIHCDGKDEVVIRF
jgi:hypothetical protein